MFEENAICKMLGLKYPIFQGGMAWLGTAELASAVSEAGGLGIIGAGHMPPDVLRAEIQKVKKATKKPFGVNIMLMSPFVKEVMQLMLDERVPVVTTGAGNPGEYIPSLKEIGTKVIPVVASVALAKRLVRTGVDAVIAEGMESGGHIGELGAAGSGRGGCSRHRGRRHRRFPRCLRGVRAGRAGCADGHALRHVRGVYRP